MKRSPSSVVLRLLRKTLLPFSWLYGCALMVRHALYDWKLLKSAVHPVPVICVGNLSFGGTGKTPLVAYLVGLLQAHYRVAVLSRGYKRVSSGFQLANEEATVASVGDEPFLYYKRFPGVLVAVDANRNRGVRNLLGLPQPPQLILLDDAFQHRRIRPGLAILLTAYAHLYACDALAPAGGLRDLKRRAKQAAIVVVTKCPRDLSVTDQNNIRTKLRLAPRQRLFFSGIRYGAVAKSATGDRPLEGFGSGGCTLVTGIAHPEPLLAFLRERNIAFEHLQYPDHHRFSGRDIALLRKKGQILTTEKDYMRLEGKLPQLWYLPIDVFFLKEGEQFNELIASFVADE